MTEAIVAGVVTSNLMSDMTSPRWMETTLPVS
jgi:hypothetical protein